MNLPSIPEGIPRLYLPQKPFFDFWKLKYMMPGGRICRDDDGDIITYEHYEYLRKTNQLYQK